MKKATPSDDDEPGIGVKPSRTAKPDSHAVKSQSSVQQSSQKNQLAALTVAKGQLSSKLKSSRKNKPAESHAVKSQSSVQLKLSRKNKEASQTPKKRHCAIAVLGVICVVSLLLLLGIAILYFYDQGLRTQEKEKIAAKIKSAKFDVEEMQDTKEEFKRLTIENEELTNDLDELEEDLRSVTAAKDTITNQLAKAKSEILGLEYVTSELKRVTSENKLLKKNLTELEDKLRSATAECQMPTCGEATIDQIDTGMRSEIGGEIETMIPGDGIANVSCDLKTDGGKWTVLQRKMDGSVDFDRDWDDYVTGFGNVRGEFWLGLEAIYQLTRNGDQELRIDMVQSSSGLRYYAKYSSFKLGPRTDYYSLHASGYSGNASDAINSVEDTGNIQGQPFSTRDADRDKANGLNCAAFRKSGWWFNACGQCNLNGLYGGGDGAGAFWTLPAQGRQLMKFTEMKLRKLKQ